VETRDPSFTLEASVSEGRFTEVTRTPWGGRIKWSFKGIILGLTLFLGAFVLSPSLVQEIHNWLAAAVDTSAPLPSSLGSGGMAYHRGFYMSQDPEAQAIGDIRISFNVVHPGPVSLIAAQQGQTFRAYATDAGGSIHMLQADSYTAAEMFKTAHFHNRLLTRGVRAGGLMLMFVGLVIVLKPLSVFADVIPLVGNLIEAGTGIRGGSSNATAVVRRAVALNPVNGSALYNLGVLRNKTGDTTVAIDCFRHVVGAGHERAQKLLRSQKIGW
jgi:hypothetical protein